MGCTNGHSDFDKCNDFPILKHVQTSSEVHTLKSLSVKSEAVSVRG